MKALLVPFSVLAISACAPTVPLDTYNSDIATANAEISMATATIQSLSANATVIAGRLYTAEARVDSDSATANAEISMATALIQSFSANATVIAARLYAAEACVVAMASTAQANCETALSASTATPTPTSSLAPWSASTATPTPRSSLAPLATPAPASPSDGTRTYSDPKYGFSLSYPAQLDIGVVDRAPFLYLGEQIHVAISDGNPLECRGDWCPVVESSNPTTIAGLDARKVEGYKGAIGGEIPQRYLRYIVEHDNLYYSFTLWALGRHAQNKCCSVIYPLDENDVALFEQILDTLAFTN